MASARTTAQLQCWLSVHIVQSRAVVWWLLIHRNHWVSISFSVSSIQHGKYLVLQLGYALAADGADEYRLDAFRQVAFELFLHVFIHHVALGDGQKTLLVQQFGIVFLQFVEQHMVLLGNLQLFAADHEEQNRVSLDVAQETQSEALALGGALDDAGDICDAERLVVAVLHNAQIGHQGGEGVVGYLGFGGADDAQQGALARVGEAHQAHVGQHLQLYDHPPLLGGLAGLGVAGRLVGGALEVVVAQAAAAALGDDELLALLGHLADLFAGLGVAADAAQRHFQYLVLARAAGAEVLAAVLAVLGEDVLGVLQVQQGPPLRGAAQDDVAAAPAVAAVGTRLGVVFHPQQVRTSRAALAAPHQYLDVVYEVRCHCLS